MQSQDTRATHNVRDLIVIIGTLALLLGGVALLTEVISDRTLNDWVGKAVVILAVVGAYHYGKYVQRTRG